MDLPVELNSLQESRLAKRLRGGWRYYTAAYSTSKRWTWKLDAKLDIQIK